MPNSLSALRRWARVTSPRRLPRGGGMTVDMAIDVTVGLGGRRGREVCGSRPARATARCSDTCRISSRTLSGNPCRWFRARSMIRRILGARKVVNAATDAVAVRIIEGAQTHDRPGGLAGPCWGLCPEDGNRRRCYSVSPQPPSGVLDAFKPVAGFDEPTFDCMLSLSARKPPQDPGQVP